MKQVLSLAFVSVCLISCRFELPDNPIEAQIEYLGNFNSEGKPHYLVAKGDTVSQELLGLINASLPPGQSVPIYNPGYLEDGLVTNVNLIGDADLWVTFVHEGAAYCNAIGYYTYQSGTAPNRVEDISSFHIIFPNVSLLGSGGQLSTGDKVLLGHFTAGTSVGWFLVPDGWNKTTHQVDIKPGVKYSDKILNSFTAEAYRQHITLLSDPVHQMLILGIEDMSRPNGDNDFNDAVFYVTANPFEAIQIDKLAHPKL